MGEMEEKVNNLEAENRKLRRLVETCAAAVEREKQEKETMRKKLMNYIENSVGDRVILGTIKEYQDRYSDYGEIRKQSLRYHLDQLERLIQPTQTTKMGLLSLFQEDSFYDPEDTTTLWGMLCKELDITEAQHKKMIGQRPCIADLTSDMEAIIRDMKQIRSKIYTHHSNMYNEFDKLRSLLTPKQVAKFILWVDHNRACVQMLKHLAPSSKILPKAPLKGPSPESVIPTPPVSNVSAPKSTPASMMAVALAEKMDQMASSNKAARKQQQQHQQLRLQQQPKQQQQHQLTQSMNTPQMSSINTNMQGMIPLPVPEHVQVQQPQIQQQPQQQQQQQTQMSNSNASVMNNPIVNTQNNSVETQRMDPQQQREQMILRQLGGGLASLADPEDHGSLPNVPDPNSNGASAGSTTAFEPQLIPIRHATRQLSSNQQVQVQVQQPKTTQINPHSCLPIPSSYGTSNGVNTNETSGGVVINTGNSQIMQRQQQQQQQQQQLGYVPHHHQQHHQQQQRVPSPVPIHSNVSSFPFSNANPTPTPTSNLTSSTNMQQSNNNTFGGTTFGAFQSNDVNNIKSSTTIGSEADANNANKANSIGSVPQLKEEKSRLVNVLTNMETTSTTDHLITPEML
eukprot:TRINITY_DN31_c0_g2_i3.p1 TRINITY_DN31_c0_g2~~TRINITY_DN31_c0_g2_i3.p1  ORF type:complete len:625 (+),score=223.06 TRINITY_DN31_c0_g2_i3:586-2460(+)